MNSSTRTDHTNATAASPAPALDVQMSWWTMSGLGEAGREWSLEERFARIAEAGYDGINGFLPAKEEAERWNRLLKEYGLSFSVNAYPRNAADMQAFLQEAQAYGGAERIQYVNAQVLTPFVTGESALELLRDIQRLSADAGISVFVETHRGTITQDLIRTAEYVRSIGDLKLTIDYSHYVVAGEMHHVPDEAEALLQQLLVQTSSIHARVSNGEQIQVDVGEQGEHPILDHYKRWWADGMRHWLRQAAPGQRFPFVCELGPASYAITTDEATGRTNEISDRWSQSLYFQQLARTLWNEIQ
ncbi:sugar phosphate isomerase/epimerase family protein [Paenibacillus gorillae]|uniref:sugar phosphate isomerase/epimerase family protein n=1 Tax=Paenibacillus gorillae TaxID=1243662 RepID=UPI001EE3514D|nr:TIM barrel protein [Paenibacillus gorillae]